MGMGGMGGNVRVPGKSGLTFDHILSRLQGELQKSRETGAELHSLTNAMNDIHETLGGNIVRSYVLLMRRCPYMLLAATRIRSISPDFASSRASTCTTTQRCFRSSTGV